MIIFSIWMILCMRNYVRFQVKIDLSMAISTINDFTCLVGNSSKSSMINDMFDFKVLKFFDINTRSGKVLHPLLVRWEFSSPVRLKLILMMLLGILLILLLVVVFSMRVCGSLLVIYLLFLIFRLLCLLSFMELYMLLKKLKRCVLLVYGLNVIMSWFVLHVLLGL